MKRYMAVLGSVMFCVVCFSLYLMLETTTGAPSGQNIDMGENDLSSIEAKIKRIESDLQRNHKTINLIKDTVRDIANGDTQSLNRLQKALAAQGSQLFLPGDQKGRADGANGIKQVFNVSGGHKSVVSVPKDMCSVAEKGTSSADIQMAEVFNTLPFDNPDGGVWKQGYPVTYSEQSFVSNPLRVFVVPHSHCDPGWLKTFERYYTEQTRNILNNMVDKLEVYPDMRFIYAEMSFFSMWWSETTVEKQQRAIKLLKERRLEIVTGGWVMTDEANAHYYAMIDQLIEGNQWLLDQVGVRPQSGWAIDPFGHTPTMAYILKRSGFDNMLIQRTHYAIKKHLAKSKHLEFLWRQNWDQSGSTDMFCHMMPFYSYDVPHTCGPDPKVCCQFDFKRLPGGRVSCPWKVAPTVITEHNVEERSRMILDQWRKKSTLYQHNVVLVPLGDDFRYDKPIEWDQQYNNYKKLFTYINARKDWNVHAQFGTLSDYFGALRERAGTSANHLPQGYPSLSGDFFSYADRDDHYWSGYFTSRPFYKRLDRVLEHNLRGAEIAFSLARAYAKKYSMTSFPEDPLQGRLMSARRGLGLFQHHDGITGTAKDFVVVDYGQKLLRAIMDTKEVIRQSAALLISKEKGSYTHRGSTPFLDIDEMRGTHDSLPVKTVITLNKETWKPVVLYNSLSHARQTTVRLHVNSPFVEIEAPDGVRVPNQVLPFWRGREAISDHTYVVVFSANVPAVGFGTYFIRQGEKDERHNYISQVTLYKLGLSDKAHRTTSRYPNRSSSTQAGRPTSTYGPPSSVGPFDVEKKPSGEDFSIENSELRADFSGKDGMLRSLTLLETNTKLDTQIRFVTYGTRSSRERSGAYLFLPGAPANPFPAVNSGVRVIQGPILSEVHVFMRHVQHVFSLSSSPGVESLGLDILNLVDIRQETNYELVMRIETGIKNVEKDFYTDLNGFQVLRRKTFDKLPLQGNFYPMPTVAFLEDNEHRFSVLSGQSLGVASLKQGQLEIVQDRTLNQDDSRGLGQGVTDNKQTPNIFRLHLEHRSKPKAATSTGFLSLTAGLSSRELLHPVIALPGSDAPEPPEKDELLTEAGLLKAELPCELHVLNLRTLSPAGRPRPETALLLHHTGFDCSLPTKGVTCPLRQGTVTLQDIFKDINVKEATSSSLSLIHDGEQVDVKSAQSIPPMEIQAYKLKLG